MSASKQELRRRLAELGAAMPTLIRQSPKPDALNAKVTKQAHDLLDDAADEDETWAFGQLDQLLKAFGLPPLTRLSQSRSTNGLYVPHPDYGKFVRCVAPKQVLMPPALGMRGMLTKSE